MPFTFNTLRIYTTLYHTYLLLYCKGQIQIISNYRIIDVEKENNKVKECQRQCQIQYTQDLYYIISQTPSIYCKGHIQMISHYRIIDVETEKNRVKKCQCHTQYTQDLYYIVSHLPTLNRKRYIQIISNYSTIDVKEENNRVKMSTLHSIHLGFILHYIANTFYLL